MEAPTPFEEYQGVDPGGEKALASFEEWNSEVVPTLRSHFFPIFCFVINSENDYTKSKQSINYIRFTGICRETGQRKVSLPYRKGFDWERLAFWREEVTLPGAELIHFDSGTMEVILRLSDGKILQVHPMMITSAS